MADLNQLDRAESDGVPRKNTGQGLARVLSQYREPPPKISTICLERTSGMSWSRVSSAPLAINILHAVRRA